MVARSGLFVAPVPGTPPVGTSPTDARLALAGLFGTVPQLERGGAITQSGSVMQFTVAGAVWQLPDVTNAAATFMSATDLVVLTAAAGPGTGSRLDAIAVKQNNYENGDADSRANVIIIAGTPGAPGVLPTIPAAYWLYASILVPTSAANAAACTVTVFGATTSIAIRNAQFVNPVQGNQFWRNDKGRMETYFGLYNVSSNPGGKTTAGWYQTSGNPEVGAIVYNTSPAWGDSPSNPLRVEKNNGLVTVSVSAVRGTAGDITGGEIVGTLPLGYRPTLAFTGGAGITNGGNPVNVVVKSAGTLNIYNAATGQASVFAGLSFRAVDTPVVD